jgi:hypothetical protein
METSGAFLLSLAPVSHRRHLERMGEQLLRFWFDFDSAVEVPVGFRLGCGVTAHSEADAYRLLNSIWPSAGDPPVSRVVAEVDRAQLEQNHVLPNVGDLDVRGVWFPNFGPAPITH